MFKELPDAVVCCEAENETEVGMVDHLSLHGVYDVFALIDGVGIARRVRSRLAMWSPVNSSGAEGEVDTRLCLSPGNNRTCLSAC